MRAHFTFKLSWEYCLLDPMDVGDDHRRQLGLGNYPVRIISIEEDDKGLLDVTAEELTAGVSTPALYPTRDRRAFLPNAAFRRPVNAPLIYEPPPALTRRDAAGLGRRVGRLGRRRRSELGRRLRLDIARQRHLFASRVITQPLRQGVLTAALPPASGWDATDTLRVSSRRKRRRPIGNLASLGANKGQRARSSTMNSSPMRARP